MACQLQTFGMVRSYKYCVLKLIISLAEREGTLMLTKPTSNTVVTVDFDEKTKSFYFVVLRKDHIVHSQDGFSHPSTARIAANMWLHQYEKNTR